MIYIGIDPGEHTGLAIWDTTSGQFLEVVTLPLWQALDLVRQWNENCLADREDLIVVFEDARKRTWFAPEQSRSEYRGKLMGAGAAKRDAKIWEEFLQDNGIDYRAHKPQAGWTKWKRDYWELVTGWTGRTSEHARDAALLVFGMK